ncbi:MAG: hypothetical protein ACREXY_09035 [Gammaproteobacteria bacterium]
MSAKRKEKLLKREKRKQKRSRRRSVPTEMGSFCRIGDTIVAEMSPAFLRLGINYFIAKGLLSEEEVRSLSPSKPRLASVLASKWGVTETEAIKRAVATLDDATFTDEAVTS